MKIALLLLIMIITSHPAVAETYRWEDAEAVHFTDNPESVPEKYREKIIRDSREEIETAESQVDNNLPQINNQIYNGNKYVVKNVAVPANYPVNYLYNNYVAKNIKEDFAPFPKTLAAVILISAAVLMAWIIVLADIIRSEFTEHSKAKWLLLVVFTVPVGMLLYLMFGLEQKDYLVAHYKR